jgi:thiol-disulfide isomerase/thioredoxin
MKFSKQLLFVLNLILLLSNACKSQEEKKGSNVTFIINNETNNSVLIRTEQYYDNLQNNEIISHKKNDTLSLKINGYLYAYFSHKDAYADTVLIASNDTVKIHATAASIQAANVNPHQLDNFFSADALRKSNNFKIDSLSRLFYSINTKLPALKGYSEFSKFQTYPLKVNRSAIVAKNAEFSLLRAMLYQDYMYKIKTISNSADHPQPLITFLKYKTNADYYEKLSLLFNLSNSKSVADSLNSRTFINNNLINNPYCNKILIPFLKRKVIVQKADYSRSKEYINFKEAYDYAPKFLQGDLLKYARYLSLEKMMDYDESTVEIKKRYTDFNNLYKDLKLDASLKQKLSGIINDKMQAIEDLVLYGVNGKETTLRQVLNEAKDKVVYIDFWASWCAPCREAMPKSLSLKKEFENKPVLFLYLSIDKDRLKWEEASGIEGLAYNNYQILNQNNSKFLKQIALSTIPRYMLYGKNGVIINKNAPGPSSEEIKKLINNYIK